MATVQVGDHIVASGQINYRNITEHLHEFVSPEWEYFDTLKDYTDWLTSLLAGDDGDAIDNQVSEALVAITEMLSNHCNDINAYIDNYYFDVYFDDHHATINDKIKNLNVSFIRKENKIILIENRKRKAVVEGTSTATENGLPSKVSASEATDDINLNLQNTDENNMDTTNNNSENNSMQNTSNKDMPNITNIPKQKIYQFFVEIPPNYKKFLEELRKGQPDFEAKITGQYIQITTPDMETYRKLQAFLVHFQLPFYSVDPSSERPKKVLLKGLPANTPQEDIRDALLEYGLEPISISRLKSKREENRGAPLPLFALTIRNTPKFENIYKIKYINYLKIHIENFKKNQYKQCYQCQEWGHSSFVCHRARVCCKCSENHPTNTCQITDPKNFKCKHCAGSHTASSRQCPRHPANRKTAGTQNPKNNNSENTKQPPKIIQTRKSFTTPVNNPWNILADRPENGNAPPPPSTEDFPALPGTSAGTSHNNKQKTPKQKNPPITQTTAENKTYSKQVNQTTVENQTITTVSKNTAQKTQIKTKTTNSNSTQGTFAEILSFINEIRDFMKTYNISDILQLFKTISGIFADKEMALMDKMAAIFEQISTYCSSENHDE